MTETTRSEAATETTSSVGNDRIFGHNGDNNILGNAGVDTCTTGPGTRPSFPLRNHTHCAPNTAQRPFQ